MTREERDKVIRILQWLHDNNFLFRSTEEDVKYATKLAIQELQKEPCEDKRNIEEIAEVMKCNADADTKCRMISNILNAKPHYFKSQEPCDDAISRQQCIDAVNKILAQYVPKIYLYTLPLELEKAITNLPSVSTEKTGRWIPVSQKLPDKYGIYLVTLNNHDTDFCEFYPNDKTFGMNGNVCYEVTAWMPLPQPMKVGEENC